MGIVLASHQLGRTFTDPIRDPAAQEAPMIQEEPQQVQVRATALAPQREVVAQPRAQVFDQGAASGCLRHALRHSVEDGTECSAHPGA